MNIEGDDNPKLADVDPDPQLGIPDAIPTTAKPSNLPVVITDARRRNPGDPQPRKTRDLRPNRNPPRLPPPLSPNDARALLDALAAFDSLPIATDDDRILQALLGRIVSVNLRRLVTLVLLPDPPADDHAAVTRRFYARAHVLSSVATVLRQSRIDSPPTDHVRDYDPRAIGTLGQDVDGQQVTTDTGNSSDLANNNDRLSKSL